MLLWLFYVRSFLISSRKFVCVIVCVCIEWNWALKHGMRFEYKTYLWATQSQYSLLHDTVCSTFFVMLAQSQRTVYRFFVDLVNSRRILFYFFFFFFFFLSWVPPKSEVTSLFYYGIKMKWFFTRHDSSSCVAKMFELFSSCAAAEMNKNDISDFGKRIFGLLTVSMAQRCAYLF